MGLPVLLYTLAALALSALLLPFQYFIGHDGVWYARMAENIMAGRGVSVNPGEPYTGHPPFYPIMVGLANFIFRDVEFSGHLISLLAFSLTVVPLFLIARAVYPPRTAHWVSLLYVTNGFLLIHSNLVMAETLFISLAMFLLYGTLRIIEEDQRLTLHGALLGVLAAAAYLTRPEGLLFYAAGILSILLLSLKPPRSRAKVVLVSLIAFLVLISPYARFVYQNTKKPQMTSEVTRLFILRQLDVSHKDQWEEAKKIFWGISADKKRPRAEELEKEFSLIDCLTKDNFALLRSFLPSAMTRSLELNQYLFGGLGFFFIGASWFAVPWDKRRRRSEITFLLFLVTFLPQLVGYFLAKRYLLIFPILLIWMGNGIETFRNWVEQSFRLTQKQSTALALGVCLFFVFPSAWYLHRTLTNFPMTLESKEMGMWIRDNIPGVEKERVAARHPAVNFYSGAKFLWLPYVDNLQDLKTYLPAQGARHLVVSSDLDSPFLEAYRPLLDETRPSLPGFIRRHVVTNGKKIILYELSA